jgi:hypothetical protein
MKIKKIELLFYFQSVMQCILSRTTMKHLKHKQLRIVAESPSLLNAHLGEMQRHFTQTVSASVSASASAAIRTLLNLIGDQRKMVVRMIQVQQAQINKYWNSIRNARKTVKRGAPASLESVTTETMVQMALRVIQDLKDAIPSLIEPLVTRINGNLRKLQQRMLLLTKAAQTTTD